MNSVTFIAHRRAPVRLVASAAAVFLAFPALAQSQTDATLKDVVVSATRFDESAGTLPYGVSVITQDDIRRAGVTTVNQALIQLLGVSGHADYFGGGDYGLDLRGFGSTAGSNQVVVVDGIRLNEADTSGTRLAGIAIDSVAKIEVVRGSGAVLYGEGATGGVIVITTKAGRGSDRRNAADLYTALGSNALKEVRASGTLVAGGFSLDVTGNNRQTDNHRDNFKSTTDGASAQAQWSNDWLRVGASYAHDTLDSGLPGALSALQYTLNPAQTLHPNDHGNIVNTRQTAFAQADIGAWQLGLDLGSRSKSLDSVNSGYAYGYQVDADTLALRAKNDSRWGAQRNALVFGYDQNAWKRDVPGAYGSVSEQKTHALYVRDELTLATGSRVSAGYRNESIGQTDSAAALDLDHRQTAWEMGLLQPLSPKTAVFGRIGNSYRLANVDELGYTQAGTMLQPQTSRDIELGSRWSYAGGRAELRYYRHNLNNELGFDPTVANPTPWDPSALGANVNFDPTRRQGVELETRHSLSKTLDLQANLGVRQAVFTQGAHAGKTVPLAARTSLALRADWQFAPAQRLNAGVVWVSDQNVDFDNQCKVPSYAVADARYAYQLRNVELSLGIANLFDSRYYTQAYRCASGVTNAIYPEAGRAFTASLRAKF